ncbi:MAG TPA: hypothetical protein VFT45_00225 [Longimicrobium sp.]|nr:hypothetical protein [Longimicrobium sp.]
MKNHIALVAGLAALAACSDAPTHPETALPELTTPSFSYWGVDNDLDGIDDGTESDLANTYAPVLFMPHLISRADAGAGVAGDWTWPANVEWYLANTQMRFHHDNCPDHQILNLGTITTSNLTTRSHQRATSWLGCSHSGTTYQSGTWNFSTENHFFLQAVNDDVTHPGVRDPSQWPVYARVYRNAMGGYSIQYWFFYAYNDYIGSANHEGDWEHINVALKADGTTNAVWFGQHNGEKQLQPYQVTWYNGTHPQVWVADGSHASYPSEGECDATLVEGTAESCWSNLGERWFTWANGMGADYGLQGKGVINVGEAGTPMPGQGWIRYSGRWGEVGALNDLNIDGTSGPPSPIYQASWTRDQP